MAIDFSSLLSDEQKKSILEQRINQFASEAYQHVLNKQTSQAIGDEAGIEAADKAIAVIESAIEIHKSELEALA